MHCQVSGSYLTYLDAGQKSALDLATKSYFMNKSGTDGLDVRVMQACDGENISTDAVVTVSPK